VKPSINENSDNHRQGDFTVTRIGEPGGRFSRTRDVQHWTILLLFFSGVFFLTFPLIILGDRQFFLRDFHPFFYPQKFFLAVGLDHFSLPLWLPHVGCGVPFFASLQPGVAYPPSLLLSLCGSFDLGLKLLVGFHFLLAFVSAAALARFLFRSGPWACCLTGAAYAFGGYLASSVSQLNNLQSAAWAPLVLLVFFRLVRRPTIAGLFCAALVSALQLLGGGVEVTVLTGAAALVLSVFGFVRPEGGHRDMGSVTLFRRRWRGPSLVVGALCLALALSAFQVLPTLEMAGRSSRAGGGLTDGEASSYSLQPANLMNITVPRRLTDPGQPDYFNAFSRGGVPWLISIYQGVVVLYIALVGLLVGSRRLGLRLALFLCAAAGVFLALGESFPLTAALLGSLPGAGWFRYPEKLLFLGALTIPLLAALGCREHTAELPRGNNRPGSLWPMAAEGLALVLPLGCLAMSWVVERRGGSASAVGIPLFLLAMAVAVRFLTWRKVVGGNLAVFLLALLVAADLSTAHRPLNAMVPADFYRDPPAAARLILGDYQSSGTGGARFPPRCRSTLPGLAGGPPATERPTATPQDTHLVWRAYLSPNIAGLYGISQVRGSTGMELRSPAQRERLLATVSVPDKLALLSLWGVTWLVMDRELACADDLELVTRRLDLPGQKLYRLRRSLPRLFLVESELAGSYGRFENRVQTTGAGMSEYVQALRRDLQHGGSLGEETRLTAWSPSRLSVEVTVQREGMLLAFTESHDPGWEALVDGRPAVVEEGLGGFSLILLPGPGRHRLDLCYRPPGLFCGTVVSLTTFLLLFLLAVFAGRRARIGRAPATEGGSG